MNFDPKQFYSVLEKAQNHINSQCSEAGVPVPYMFVYCGLGYNETAKAPNIKLETLGSEAVKVEGKDLGELVEEYIRRVGFDKRQKALQLSGPVIDGEISSHAG